MHVHTCTHFSAVDLKPGNKLTIQSDCIRHNETIDNGDFTISEGDSFSLKEYHQKTLNSNGYKQVVNQETILIYPRFNKDNR